MGRVQQINVTLPDEMAAQVRRKVSLGEYADESEVIREGLRALAARDRALEHWLVHQALPAYDSYRENPSSGASLEEVRASFSGKS